MADDVVGRISTRQAAAVLTARVGRRVMLSKVEYLLAELAKQGEVAWRQEGEYWQVSEADVDVLEGELVRRQAPWFRRAVMRDVFRAWVRDVDGGLRLMALPYAWAGGTGVEAERQGVEPDVLPIWDWPLARRLGALQRDGDHLGRPLYREVGVAGGSVADVSSGEVVAPADDLGIEGA